MAYATIVMTNGPQATSVIQPDYSLWRVMKYLLKIMSPYLKSSWK